MFEVVHTAKSLLDGGILFFITTFGNEVEQVMPSAESPVKFFAKFNWWLIQLPYWFKASFYRPQRSWAKVMFLQASVILSTGGVCLSACWDARPPPPEQTHPPGADTPLNQAPLTRHTPRTRHPPPWASPPPSQEADASMWSMSGRYASYWNAFLFAIFFVCFWNFTLLETQKIIMHEVRLNPREVRLTEVRFNEPPK